MSAKTDDRRSEPMSNLNIDRRRQDGRRDAARRPWLSQAYAEIYIAAYVNRVYPKQPTMVHAFSNLMDELSPAEWAASEMGVQDAAQKMPMRDLKAFAQEMLRMGLIVSESGATLQKLEPSMENDLEHLLLRAVG